MKKLILVSMVMLAMASVSLAAEAADAAPHPKVPQDATWVQPLVIFIIGMFVTAAIVGFVVRLIMPEEVPPTHAHDEHHGHRDPDDHAELHDPHGGHGHAAHGH